LKVDKARSALEAKVHDPRASEDYAALIRPRTKQNSIKAGRA